MKLINDGYTTLSGLNIAPTTRGIPQQITCVPGQTIFPIHVPFVRSINTVMLQAGGEGTPDTLTSPGDYSLSYDYENHNYIVTLTSAASAGDVLIVFYTDDANTWINLQNVIGQPNNVLSLSDLAMELKVVALLDAPLESNVTMRIFGGNPGCMEFCLYSKELYKNFRHDSEYASGYPQYLMTIEPVVVFPIGTSITHMAVTFSSDNSSDTSISGLIYIYDMSKSLDIATINNQEPLSDESIADVILGGTKQPITTDSSGHVLISGAKNALDDLNDFDAETESVGADIQSVKGTAVDGVGDFKADLSELDLSGLSVTVDTASIVTALKDSTGYTEGGTWTFSDIVKILTAVAFGNCKDKSGSTGTYQLLDAEDGTTVISETTLATSTPYVTTIKS